MGSVDTNPFPSKIKVHQSLEIRLVACGPMSEQMSDAWNIVVQLQFTLLHHHLSFSFDVLERVMRVPYTSSSSRISLFFQNLNEYLDSGVYCDLTFSIGCEKFRCHRIIVASSSPYFQALLTHQFKENHLDTIELADIEASTFSQLLQYIYSGKIELDDRNVHDLLIASDMFQMDEIFQFCCHYLSIGLNEENVIETWKIADELECASLKSNAEDYILTHFRDLIKHERIQDLPRPLLIKMISNDDLTVDHEQQVLEAILVWYLNNRDREQSFEQLFDNVRFEYISKEHQMMILDQLGLVSRGSGVHRCISLLFRTTPA